MITCRHNKALLGMVAVPDDRLRQTVNKTNSRGPSKRFDTRDICPHPFDFDGSRPALRTLRRDGEGFAKNLCNTRYKRFDTDLNSRCDVIDLSLIHISEPT